MLLVMARYPAPGRVKTRLAASLGEAGAAELYRAFLEDLGRRLSADRRWRLCWTFEPASSRFVEELACGCEAFAQRPGDLGERMAAAMAQAFARGAERVVLIGSDVPHLRLETIAEAFARLREGADVVLGPAVDGGYWLVGSASVPPLFEEIVWGGTQVLAGTLERARRAGLRTALLTPTYDIDTEADLRRLLDDPALPELLATRRALAGWPGPSGEG